MTGPRLLSLGDIVKLYSSYSGRRVNFRVVGEDAAIEYHKTHQSLTAEQIKFLPDWATWLHAMDEGETNYLDPTLEKLLGRKPKDIEEMASILFTAENGLDTKDMA